MTYLGPIALNSTPTYPKKGVTVGNSDSDINGGDQSAIARAHELLPSDGGDIVVDGTFDFYAPVTINKPNVRLIQSRRTQLRAFHSGATGLFSWSGLRGMLFGGQIIQPTSVANQVMIDVLAARFAIERVYAEFQAAGDTANPTVFCQLGNGVADVFLGSVQFNEIMPNKGVTIWKGNAPRNLSWLKNKYGRYGFDGSPRDCWRVYDFLNPSWLLIEQDDGFGLGSVANQMDCIGRFESASGGALHVHVDGGYWESVVCPRGYRSLGGRHTVIENMEVADFPELNVGLYCAEGSGGDAAGTATYGFDVRNVRAHDIGKPGTQGALLYSRAAQEVSFFGNKNVVAYTPTLRVDRTNTVGLLVAGNEYQSSQTGNPHVWGLINASNVLRWRAAQNTIHGHTGNGAYTSFPQAAIAGVGANDWFEDDTRLQPQ